MDEKKKLLPLNLKKRILPPYLMISPLLQLHGSKYETLHFVNWRSHWKERFTSLAKQYMSYGD